MINYIVKSKEDLSKIFSDLPDFNGCCLYLDLLNHYFLVTKPHKYDNNYHIISEYDLDNSILNWKPFRLIYKRII